MIEDLAAKTYEKMGFPIHITSSDKSDYAIITYPSWGAGFFIVDIDAHYGGMKSFERLLKTVEFPSTVTAKTPRGGLHLYYRYPKGYRIPHRIDSKLGIDILGDDSTVHMPPTFGKIGQRAYTWINAPHNTRMADPTLSLLKFIGAQKI